MDRLFLVNCENFKEDVPSEYKICPPNNMMGTVMLVAAENPCQARTLYQYSQRFRGTCRLADIEVKEVDRVCGKEIAIARDLRLLALRDLPLRPIEAYGKYGMPPYTACSACREVLHDAELRSVGQKLAYKRYDFERYKFCPYCGQRIRKDVENNVW
ncbi:MAG: hypothetical protein IKW14_04450 [Phascolarctobacterium sp.]|nr:hypothetical protein [Phascolarctobacterium sp.]